MSASRRERKVCSHCGVSKPIGCFTVIIENGVDTGRRKNECKACRSKKIRDKRRAARKEARTEGFEADNDFWNINETALYC